MCKAWRQKLPCCAAGPRLLAKVMPPHTISCGHLVCNSTEALCHHPLQLQVCCLRTFRSAAHRLALLCRRLFKLHSAGLSASCVLRPSSRCAGPQQGRPGRQTAQQAGDTVGDVATDASAMPAPSWRQTLGSRLPAAASVADFSDSDDDGSVRMLNRSGPTHQLKDKCST